MKVLYRIFFLQKKTDLNHYQTIKRVIILIKSF
jgi:hypothetical protein